MIPGVLFYPQGDHRMSRHHQDAPGCEIFDLSYYRHLAEVAESACVDASFIADHVAMWGTHESNVAHHTNAPLEPRAMLAALVVVTHHIGLVVTALASYSKPYDIACTFESLDRISNGCFGRNIVTSGMHEEAPNFGYDINIEHAICYERTEKFPDVAVAKVLLDSVEDCVLLLDKRSGFFADSEHVHRINHVGKHFRVRGPLNVLHPPQGYPVAARVGSSGGRKHPAAKHADFDFLVMLTVEKGQRHRDDIDEQLQRIGYAPGDLASFPGILLFVARSRAEVEEKWEFPETLVLARVGIDLVSSWYDLDFTKYSIEGRFPPLLDISTYDGRRANLHRLSAFAEENLAVRKIARRISNASVGPVMAGTPTEIADRTEGLVHGRSCRRLQHDVSTPARQLAALRRVYRAGGATARADAESICAGNAARPAGPAWVREPLYSCVDLSSRKVLAIRRLLDSSDWFARLLRQLEITVPLVEPS